MPITESTATLAEQYGGTVHQTPSGHTIETQWVIVSPERWESLRREEGWHKLTEFAGFIFAERILAG
jgi:hypothetical protein